MVQSPVRVPTAATPESARSTAAPPATLPPYAVSCTVLTPSGVVVARGIAAPRKREHVVEAYSVQLSEIEPPGVLEAMVYADQPDIVLRADGQPEVTLRIDHITGSPAHREFYCHLR